MSTAKEAVRQGLPFWRLFTTITNSGDIFRSEVSGSGFVIGPNSDLSSVQIQYFDQQSPNGSNIIEVSTDKPHIGRLDALNAQKYNSGNPGLLYIFLNQLIPQTGVYQPVGFVTGDNLVLEPIYLDFIQYFSPQDEYENKRTDKVFFYPTVNIPALGGQPIRSAWFVLPYYGRRYASIMFNANSGNINYVISASGVNLLTGTSLGGSNLHAQTELLPPQIVNSTTSSRTINSNTEGMWDLLVIRISTDTPAGSPLDSLNLKVITSDESN